MLKRMSKRNGDRLTDARGFDCSIENAGAMDDFVERHRKRIAGDYALGKLRQFLSDRVECGVFISSASGMRERWLALPCTAGMKRNTSIVGVITSAKPPEP